jgi:hypothetical protein
MIMITSLVSGAGDVLATSRITMPCDDGDDNDASTIAARAVFDTAAKLTVPDAHLWSILFYHHHHACMHTMIVVCSYVCMCMCCE